MYNPHALHEHEREKRRSPRGAIDALMTLVGGIGSVSSVPQIVKIWRTHTVAGISLTTELVALAVVAAWFSYGLYIRNKPIWITSGLSTLVLGTVVLQMLYYS